MAMRRLLAMLAAVAMLVAISGCSDAATRGSGGPDTLTVGLGIPATPWDLAEADSGPAAQYYQPVFDSLFRLSTDAEPTPNVATAWSYDETKTTLTLSLRSGLVFTDGIPLDAQAVRANLMHTKSGTSTAATDLRAIEDVDAIDRRTVAIHLRAPDPALLGALGGVGGMLASPKSLDGANGPVGSGPYMLDSSATTDGQVYTYRRNENYWNARAFGFDTIVIKYFGDSTASTNALLAGQLDVTPLTPQRARPVRQRGGGIIEYDAGQIQGLFIWDRAGKKVKALGNPKVRQALNLAFNRSEISKQADLGYSIPTAQNFNTSSAAYNAKFDLQYPYGPAKARALLAEAGYPNGFEVTVPDFAGKYAEAQAAMVQSLENIGITVKLDNVPSDQIFTGILAGRYAMSFFRLEATTPWRTIQLAMLTDSTWNPFRYDDPTIDKLTEKIQYAPESETDALYAELGAYTTAIGYNAPWTSVKNLYGHSKKVEVRPQRFALYPPIYQMKPTGNPAID